MLRFVPFAFAAVVVCTLACTTPPKVAEPPIDLKSAPLGAYVAGPTVGLGVPLVVNRRDFVYAAGFSPTSRDVAFVHHVSTHMELTATAIEPFAPKFQQRVNASEFDIEDVAFLRRGGQTLWVVPSRQGIARAFDGETGQQIHEHTVGVPLTRVAVSPNQQLLALSTSDGRVLLLRSEGMMRIGDLQPLRDEVRGLAFVDDNTIVAAGFDGQLVTLSIKPGAEAVTRLPTGKLKGGERVFLTFLGEPGAGLRGVSTVRDTRQPSTTITADAVKRLKLAPLEGELPVVTPIGPKNVPVVALDHVSLGVLSLGAVRAAVCDECVPIGAELSLGADVLLRAVFTDDIAKDEVVVRPTEAEGHAVVVPGAMHMAIDQKVTLPGPATDLDVSRTGVVAVSYSHARAERTFDLYDAEKNGIYPEPSAKSGVVIVDARTGTLSRPMFGHRGFTVSTAISPDGKTVVSGGWDKRVLVFDATTGQRITEREVAWLVRRVRFAPDGHLLAVAAWTPVNVMNEGDSDPALLLYPVEQEHPTLVTPKPPTAALAQTP